MKLKQDKLKQDIKKNNGLKIKRTLATWGLIFAVGTSGVASLAPLIFFPKMLYAQESIKKKTPIIQKKKQTIIVKDSIHKKKYQLKKYQLRLRDGEIEERDGNLPRAIVNYLHAADATEDTSLSEQALEKAYKCTIKLKDVDNKKFRLYIKRTWWRTNRYINRFKMTRPIKFNRLMRKQWVKKLMEYNKKFSGK